MAAFLALRMVVAANAFILDHSSPRVLVF